METVMSEGRSLAELSQCNIVHVEQWTSRQQRFPNSVYGNTRTENVSFNNMSKTFAGRTTVSGHGYGQRGVGEYQRSFFNGQKSAEALMIEWDSLDSFHEFAIYLENANPICPAEHLDTPEKLMKLLGM